MVADEKITWLAGAEVVVPTTVGGACVLGISVTGHATRESLAQTYGEVVAEATAVFPDSQARSGCADGFHATCAAWRRLFPRLTPGALLPALAPQDERALPGSVAPPRAGSDLVGVSGHDQGTVLPTPASVAEWARATLAGAVAEMVSKACRHRADFTSAYDCPQLV
jgi:hypothetical protein